MKIGEAVHPQKTIGESPPGASPICLSRAADTQDRRIKIYSLYCCAPSVGWVSAGCVSVGCVSVGCVSADWVVSPVD